ncbi:glycosyltransferase [Rhodococcus koreensis]|uniref:glycosyltransferase n=1 Tax=Rhodococcus koreensis TaxID=99653 RepID=UPI00197FF455|nr:glycosyltransferase [Rhodococcus koreensis]QSE86876.1 glycosyltransferase [Rhodococcus koreensis]
MSGAPLRIALLASSQHPIRQPFAGGLESHVWWLARALSAGGHRVTLFAGPGSDPALECAHLAVRPLEMSAAAQVDSSMPSTQFMAEHHAYLQLMLDLAGPLAGAFDVIHNHSLHYLPVAMADTVPTPILCTLHTPPTPWLESAIAVSRGQGAEFAAVSAHTAAAWAHVVGDIDVIPNGVDLAAWPVGAGGRRLIWFGRLVPEKGAHLAIIAARRAGYPLVLAGPISDTDYFVRSISPHLGSGVTYLGHLEQPALAEAIGGSAAALVTPVWDEPYGLVVAEALACGTPVAAFARGGIPEVLTADCGRLVPPDELGALVRAIPETVGLSRMAARARAEEHCSDRVMVDAYIDVYRRLTRAHRTGQSSRYPSSTA